MATAWRTVDEGLLTRLEDEAVMERAWRVIAGEGARPLHPRAAGILEELRRSVDGAVITEQARRGELAPLLRAIASPPIGLLTPRLAHHLALANAALAVELEARGDDARRGTSVRAWLNAIAMWTWLGAERRYLEGMAAAVVGTALPSAQRARAVDDASTRILADLGARARDGARTTSEAARVALMALARVHEATQLAEVDDETRHPIELRARREREGAIEAALARVDEALEEAIVAGAPTDEVGALLWDAAAVWRWSDKDEIVERALIQRVTPYLWDRYRAREWDALRQLLRPLEEPVDHLAQAIERDPTKLAYAAPCAQMIVFRAELASGFEGQLSQAERAVRLCPTHRNGRLILADLLLERALRSLERAMPWRAGEARDAAIRDVHRAEELYPQLRRLPEVKARVEAAIGKKLVP